MHILIERVGDCLTASILFLQSDRLKAKTRECEFKLIPNVAFLTAQDVQFRWATPRATRLSEPVAEYTMMAASA
jgi:hypothetical protein